MGIIHDIFGTARQEPRQRGTNIHFGWRALHFNQIGNAVAPFFAYHLALNIKKYLTDEQKYLIKENEQYKLFENEAIYKSR